MVSRNNARSFLLSIVLVSVCACGCSSGSPIAPTALASLGGLWKAQIRFESCVSDTKLCQSAGIGDLENIQMNIIHRAGSTEISGLFTFSLVGGYTGSDTITGTTDAKSTLIWSTTRTVPSLTTSQRDVYVRDGTFLVSGERMTGSYTQTLTRVNAPSGSLNGTRVNTWSIVSMTRIG